MTPEPVPTPDTTAVNGNGNGDPFRYGWRDVQKVMPDGSVEWDRVPLTLEDVLHPKVGDVIPQDTEHSRDGWYLMGAFRVATRDQNGVLVMFDCLVDFGLEGVKPISPDVCVAFNVADPDRRRGIFHCDQEGTRPRVVVEVVSPDTRANDVEKKPPIYHQAGVECSVLVDQKKEGGPRTVGVTRRRPHGWEEVPPDSRGRCLIEPLGLLIGLSDGKLLCWDAATGKEVPDMPMAVHALDEMSESMETEIGARQAAERNAREAVAAWEAAQQQARKEAAAREAAEQKAREESAAREAAQQMAHEEAAARQALEQRLRDLEAELARVRGDAPK